MKDNKLTPNIINKIKNYKISEKDVLSVCPVDISAEGEYILGYVYLTKQYLGVCESKVPETIHIISAEPKSIPKKKRKTLRNMK